MKLIHLSLLLLSLAGTIPISLGAVGNDTGELSQEAKTNFVWFSGLGFPDLKGCPFVHVATGLWYQSNNEPRHNQYVDAFLIASNAGDFSIFSMDLSKNTLKYSTNGAPEYLRVGFEPIVLEEVVNAVLTNHLVINVKLYTNKN